MRWLLLLFGSLALGSCLGPRECRDVSDCLPNSFCERTLGNELGVCRQEGDGGRR
jgi:hypothetical protein